MARGTREFRRAMGSRPGDLISARAVVARPRCPPTALRPATAALARARARGSHAPSRSGRAPPVPAPRGLPQRPSLRRRGGVRARLAELKREWPCRDRQIDELVALVGSDPDGDAACPYAVVCGPPSTGKSTVVGGVLRALRRRHAWVPLLSCETDEQVFRSILLQLAPANPTDQLAQALVSCR